MSSLSSDRSVSIQRSRQRERFQVKPASNILQCCVFLSSPALTLPLSPPPQHSYLYLPWDSCSSITTGQGTMPGKRD